MPIPVNPKSRSALPAALSLALTLLITGDVGSRSRILGAHNATPILDPARVVCRVLPNRARVVVSSLPGRGLVAVLLWVHAGSRQETAATNGIAHLREHLVFQDEGPDSLKAIVEDTGGTVNGETEKDSTRYYAVIPARAFESVLKSLMASVTSTSWTQRDLLFARDEVTREIRGVATDPFRVANELAFRTAFREHPYGLSAGGDEDGLQSISLARLRGFHERYYVASNLSLVVAGDIDPARVFAAAQEIIGHVPAGTPARSVSVPSESWSNVRSGQVQRSVRLATLTMAFPAPGIDQREDVWAMDVLVTLLGEGRRSRLSRRLVHEARLALDADVRYLTRRDPGLLVITLIVRPENLEPARQALLKEIESLRGGSISPEEIMRARANLEGAYAGQNETADGQATSLGFYEAIDTYETAIAYPDLVRAVTPARLRAVAAKCLNPNVCAQVTVTSDK